MPRIPLSTRHVLLVAFLSWGTSAAALSAPTQADQHNAAGLLALQTEFQSQLQSKTFGEPLHVASQDSGKRLQADVYSELDAPFSAVATLLTGPEALCNVLFLHLNVRSCEAKHGTQNDVLMLTGGPKQGSSVGGTYSIDYAMHVDSSSADYRRVTLAAPSGPLST